LIVVIVDVDPVNATTWVDVDERRRWRQTATDRFAAVDDHVWVPSLDTSCPR